MNKEDLEISDEYVDTKDALHLAITRSYDLNPLNMSDKIKSSIVYKKIVDIFPDASSQKVKNYLQSKKVTVKIVNGYMV